MGKKIFYKNEPVCYFDTLKTSTMEGAATTVYAQGGRGNARLMSWDGERTVTFTMEDALISPIGLSILTGAGLIEANYDSNSAEGKQVIQHITETVEVKIEDTVRKIYVKQKPYVVANNSTIYVMILDGNGEVKSEPYLAKYSGSAATANGYEITVPGTFSGYSTVDNPGPRVTDTLASADIVLVDYYTAHDSDAFEVNITPDKFGGTFYLEASTLWRDQATKKDLPAEFIIPACRVQSNFTFSMSSSGDPSTFTFTMDAFPDYTRWNKTEKVLATIQVIGAGLDGVDELTREQTWSTRQFNDDGTFNDNSKAIPAAPSAVSATRNVDNNQLTIEVTAPADVTYDKINIVVYEDGTNNLILDSITNDVNGGIFAVTLNASKAYLVKVRGIKDNIKSAFTSYTVATG